VTVAIEARRYWAWLTERLEAAGVTVRVAHAYQAKLIWQARSKTDRIDARKLAKRLRTNFAAHDLGRQRRDPRAPATAPRPGLPRAAAHATEEPHSWPSRRRTPPPPDDGPLWQ